MCLSHSKFKIYENIIIHYKDTNVDFFLKKVSNILADAVIKFYETKSLNKIITSNYFYFTDIEQRKILTLCQECLNNSNLTHYAAKKDIISSSSEEYFANNKSLIVDGFVNFRIKDYIKLLDSIVDLSVNKFVIDREYSEFIDLLKVYINSKEYRF